MKNVKISLFSQLLSVHIAPIVPHKHKTGIVNKNFNHIYNSHTIDRNNKTMPHFVKAMLVHVLKIEL